MNKPIMIMMCGLAASGKSHRAQELANQYKAIVFSSDKMREELYGDVNDQSHNAELFQELHSRVRASLKEGINVIIDSTNINYKQRMSFLQSLNKIACKKVCVLMATPYEVCIERNSKRERKVPEEVLKRMYMNVNIPYWYEGWDDIQIEYSGFELYYGKCADFYNKYKNYNQNNSHHQLTLGEHCKKAAMYFFERSNVSLFVAAYLHDCGKPKVATYLNSHKEITQECHYYNHQYTSAYDSLFYTIKDILHIAQVIQWHMHPYTSWLQSEKAMKRDKRLLGEDLFNDVILLHEADVVAH